VDVNCGDIEQLICKRAQTDQADARMVLWKASFVSIISTMCKEMWVDRRKFGLTQVEQCENPGHFSYEFSFESPNGQVKWYKVEGNEDTESAFHGSEYEFEATGFVQDVTSMYIEKITADRWQKWWNKMCHMVFDASLLVDTQEYRVLNAWGEQKVFGCKLDCPNQRVMDLVKHSEREIMKGALNEVACVDQRGRTLHLVSPNAEKSSDILSHCYFLCADPENPNECMIGIRLAGNAMDVRLWDVSPCRFLTLEELSRVALVAPGKCLRRRHRARKESSNNSLASIPEDVVDAKLFSPTSSDDSSVSSEYPSKDAMANRSIDNRSLPEVEGENAVTHCTLRYVRQKYSLRLSEVNTWSALMKKVKDLTGIAVGVDSRTRLLMNGKQLKTADVALRPMSFEPS